MERITQKGILEPLCFYKNNVTYTKTALLPEKKFPCEQPKPIDCSDCGNDIELIEGMDTFCYSCTIKRITAVRYPNLGAAATEKSANAVLHVECDKSITPTGEFPGVVVAGIKMNTTVLQFHIDGASPSVVKVVPTDDGTIHLYAKNLLTKKQIIIPGEYPCYFKNAFQICKNTLCGKPCYSEDENLPKPKTFMEWINKPYLREIEYYPNQDIDGIYQLSDYCYWCNHSEGLPEPQITYTEETFYKTKLAKYEETKSSSPTKYVPPHIRGGKDYEKIIWEKNEEIRKLKDELNTLQQDFIRLAKRLGGV